MKMKNKVTLELTYLHIQTWKGIVEGAVHYMATLRNDTSMTDLQLNYTITDRQARELNKNARERFGDGHIALYRAGSGEVQFLTTSHLIKRALEFWGERFHNAHYLVLGEWRDDHLPKTVLAARGSDETVISKANAIVAEYFHIIESSTKLFSDDDCFERWHKLLADSIIEV